MSYMIVDPTINEWAEKNGLSVYSQYQDSEVRSVDIVSPKGGRFQIWIDQPIGNNIAVHAWDYKKRRKDWIGTIDQLARYLEEAKQTVSIWG